MRSRPNPVSSAFATPGAWPAIWCVVAAAIYGCVPETGQMRAIGVVTVGCLVLELVTRQRLSVAVHLAVVGLLLWAGLYGATGRHSAIVGALFAFWPAVIVPLVALIHPATLDRPEPVRWTIAALGGIAALIVSRTGALQPTITPALRAVAIWAPVSLAVSAAVLLATKRFESPKI